MRRGERSFLVRCGAAIALLAAALAQPSHAQAPTEPSKTENRPRNAADIHPYWTELITSALEQEQRAARTGKVSQISFPLPLCGFPGRLCGFVNRNGTFAVEPQFFAIGAFCDGRAVVRRGDVWGYIDDRGSAVGKIQYSYAWPYVRSYAQVDIVGSSGLIDRDGNTVLKPKYGYIVPFTDNSFWVTERRRYTGIQSLNLFLPEDSATDTKVASANTLPRPPQIYRFDGLQFAQSGPDFVPDGKWGLVDRSGTWIRQPQYSAVGIFDLAIGSPMWVRTEEGWGLMRKDLTWMVTSKFDVVGPLIKGLAVVSAKGKWNYVDQNGKLVADPLYESVSIFSDGIATAKLNGKIGLIDPSGRWLARPSYDSISLFSDEPNFQKWRITEVDKKYGLLDDKQRTILKPEFVSMPALCEDGRLLARRKRHPELFALDGSLIEELPFESEIDAYRRCLPSRPWPPRQTRHEYQPKTCYATQ